MPSLHGVIFSRQNMRLQRNSRSLNRLYPNAQSSEADVWEMSFEPERTGGMHEVPCCSDRIKVEALPTMRNEFPIYDDLT